MSEEHLRTEQPGFHDDQQDIEKYHSWLALKHKKACQWCDWKNIEKSEDIKSNQKEQDIQGQQDISGTWFPGQRTRGRLLAAIRKKVEAAGPEEALKWLAHIGFGLRTRRALLDDAYPDDIEAFNPEASEAIKQWRKIKR